jgi:hypothetical protein
MQEVAGKTKGGLHSRPPHDPNAHAQDVTIDYDTHEVTASSGRCPNLNTRSPNDYDLLHMPDPLIVADVDFDEFLADEITYDDQANRWQAEQDQADRVAEWQSALSYKTRIGRAPTPCTPVVQTYRRPRERRARRVVRSSGSRGDPSEPDLASRRVRLPGTPGRARGGKA